MQAALSAGIGSGGMRSAAAAAQFVEARAGQAVQVGVAHVLAQPQQLVGEAARVVADVREHRREESDHRLYADLARQSGQEAVER